jgi:hypothetical protein
VALTRQKEKLSLDLSTLVYVLILLDTRCMRTGLTGETCLAPNALLKRITVD